MAEVMEKDYASKGTAGTALGLGIAGAYGLLQQMSNGNGLGLFGNNNSKSDEKIDYLTSELMREKSERYTDQKICELKDVMYNKFEGVNASLCAQQTWNATNTANITCINNQIAQLNSLLTYGIASDKVITASTT